MAEPNDLEIDTTSLANSISARLWGDEGQVASEHFKGIVTAALAEQKITLVRDKNYQGDPDRGFGLLMNRPKEDALSIDLGKGYTARYDPMIDSYALFVGDRPIGSRERLPEGVYRQFMNVRFHWRDHGNR